MRHFKITALLVFAFFTTTIFAQEHPFLYTVTSASNLAQSAFVHYDLAYGDGTFEPIGGDRIEQNIGIQANINDVFTFVAHAGLAIDRGSNSTAQQGEVLANLMNSSQYNLVDLSAGLGMRREYSGTNVLLSRVVLGRKFSSVQLYGNLIFEKAFSADRDAVDLITTFGFSYNVSKNVRLSLEAVGQDLEGFWDAEEAEGGATLFVGPSFDISFPGTSLRLTLGGGAIMRASHSVRTSAAMRELPADKNTGFVIRNVISLGL